jgi:hypothetical protein
MKKLYKYGMRLRPAGIGAQPKDFERFEEPKQKYNRFYWNILYYSRKLTDDEMKNYDLDYLGEQ